MFNTHAGIKKCRGNVLPRQRRCARRTHRRYTQHASECFQCKHISYLYSIRMESCIHRAVRANSSPLHPSIPPPRRRMLSERRANKSEMTHSTCVRAYVRTYVRIYASRCVAFAPVILNIREDISILVGKHTNSSSTVYSCCGAYVLVQAHIPDAVVPPDLARRKEE